MPYTVNEPVPFGGTEQEAQQNFDSHGWSFADGEMRCWNCDSKSWHVAAQYPCGANVPRHDVEYQDDEAPAFVGRFAAYAALAALPREDMW